MKEALTAGNTKAQALIAYGYIVRLWFYDFVDLLISMVTCLKEILLKLMNYLVNFHREAFLLDSKYTGDTIIC